MTGGYQGWQGTVTICCGQAEEIAPNSFRLVATASYRQLHGWILLPMVICAAPAGLATGKGALTLPAASITFFTFEDANNPACK